MKQYEVTFAYGAQTITVTGIYADNDTQAQERARKVLAASACWDVTRVVEVV